MSKLYPKFNLREWVDEHRHLLKPPVGNKCIWENGEYIAMIIGGPNSRKDYHLNQTPEFYYQVEGDIVLKVIDEGEQKDIEIKEGEIYLLAPNVPHSPQRGPNTVGLVIESKRPEDMEDGLAWFCESCGNELHQAAFHVKNIETDLPIMFEKFYSDQDKLECAKCGTVMEEPQ